MNSCTSYELKCALNTLDPVFGGEYLIEYDLLQTSILLQSEFPLDLPDATRHDNMSWIGHLNEHGIDTYIPKNRKPLRILFSEERNVNEIARKLIEFVHAELKIESVF